MTDQPERFTPPPQGYQPSGNQPSGYPPPGNQPSQYPPPGNQAPGYPSPGAPSGFQPAPPVQPGYGAPGYGVANYGPPAGPVGQVRNVGTSILLAIVTLGIYTYVWTWKTSEEMKRHSGEGVGGPVGFIIYFIVSPVTWFLIPYELNNMVRRAGQPSRVSTIWGLWFLLPIIGAFVWFIRVQGQLNDYWRSRGATG
jgi:hypothetical protein